MNETTRFIVASLGIYICYFYFAIIQERITQVRYGVTPNKDGMAGERFTFALVLVAIQCYFGWILAKILLNFKKLPEDTTFFGFYISGALTYLLSMTFANMALKYINVSNLKIAIQACIFFLFILVSHTSCGEVCQTNSSFNFEHNLGRSDLYNTKMRLSIRDSFRIYYFYVQRRTRE